MNLNELKAIVLKSASNAMRKEGEEAFKKGLITYFKGKKLDHIYHLYGKVKEDAKLKEFNTHIRINLQKNKLEGVECSCDEFKEFASTGYTFMCSHITATCYKFFSLLSKDSRDSEEKSIKETKAAEKRSEDAGACRLVRKAEKDSLYYEGHIYPGGEKLIMKPDEIRAFLECIKSRKIKFKFDYLEITVPILHKDLPVTFNLKEDKGRIALTTHKKLPVPLNPNNDVYYFNNELYLPSKEQIEKYAPLYEKLAVHEEIFYRKDINNYNKLIYLLSSITRNINVSESLKAFAADTLEPEIYIFEEKGRIFCDVFLNYGVRKVNLLSENKATDNFIRDTKKEEKLVMSLEKHSFAKLKNRFIFTGGDEELFHILSKRQEGIYSLGRVVLGKGLEEREIYNSASINIELLESDGYYDFVYSIGNIGKKELGSAFDAYSKNKGFYKTKDKGYIDFEDDNIRSFFNLFEVLNLEEDIENGSAKVEKGKALYLYENIRNKGFALGDVAEKLTEMEEKLSEINASIIAAPEEFKGTLRDYQLTGFKWLRTLKELGFGGILADEMGLGKTIQTIAFLLSEKDKKALLICPTSLIYNWKEEFQKFAPDLRVLIVHGSERAESIGSISDYEVVLTTYGTLRLDIEMYRDIIFDFCIIDEGQIIKNSEALNTKVIKEINAHTRFALTGTPIENNLTELWSIFDFIMPGYLYSKERFEEKFIQRAEENLEKLKLLIKPFILRRTKKEVIKELPDKIEKKFLVEMNCFQKSVYSSYINRARSLINSKAEVKIEIFSYLTKLRQICLDPSLIVEDYEGGSSKLEVAMELVKDHIESEGKVLLFSQFATVLDKIAERLEEENIQYFHLDGRTKPKDRVSRVKEFNSSDSVKVFLISLKAGGTGLNLTSANLVIHFDPWWNPAVEDQATDRAHRIGQSQVVEVIKLVAKGTIEEKIILLQEDKKEMIQNILTGELKNSSLMGAMSREELMQLFDRD